MNHILLYEDDFTETDIVRISDHRFLHIISVIKPELQQKLKVGRFNGLLGTGVVLQKTENFIELKVELSNQPPQPLSCNLIIAMPRPKMFRRVLFDAVSLGVKQIFFIKTWRVDKNYFQSPLLTPQHIHETVCNALQQCRDSIEPKVAVYTRFKPFLEDTLPGITEGSVKIVADPHAEKNLDEFKNENNHYSLCIGPEGGFIPYEVSRLQEYGFKAVQLGDRILKVDTVVPNIIGRLFG